MANGPVERWLDGVKPGYAPRFASAFAELGVEDVSDIPELLDDAGLAALRAALEGLGAKTIQLQKILRAVSEVQVPDDVQEAAQPQSQRVPAPLAAREDVPGIVTLSEGDGPRIYAVHGIDGDVSGAGYTYRGIAPLLLPCTCCALAFDREAASCDNLRSLALVYVQRILADLSGRPPRPIILAGYSLGCMIAHLMALEFQDDAVQVSLVLFGFEVTWPPETSFQRVGGYEWLGGGIEASLLAARSLPSGQEWTAKTVQELLRCPAEMRDAIEVQRSAFDQVVSAQRKARWTDFQSYVSRAGHNMEILHQMAQQTVGAPAIFYGRVLLVLAPESPESSFPARSVNSKYCVSMEVAYAAGTHFNMLQRERAHVAAASVRAFVEYAN